MNLYKNSEDYDMIMLAPQISYMYAKVCEILKNKIVLNIPPAIFAKYDVKKMLSIIEEERNYKRTLAKGMHKPLKAKNMQPSGVKTLCLALIRNSNRVHIKKSLYDENNSILENNEIIKPTLSIQDYYDVMRKYAGKYVDSQLLIIDSGNYMQDQIISMSIKGLEKISITHDFTLKYSQKFYFSNDDANTIALGYYSSKENCSSLSFVFQPVSSNSGRSIL